ncbi:hypothetical protein MTO96_009851 [Rhipicephalus appendiculatus]
MYADTTGHMLHEWNAQRNNDVSSTQRVGYRWRAPPVPATAANARHALWPAAPAPAADRAHLGLRRSALSKSAQPIGALGVHTHRAPPSLRPLWQHSDSCFSASAGRRRSPSTLMHASGTLFALLFWTLFVTCHGIPVRYNDQGACRRGFCFRLRVAVKSNGRDLQPTLAAALLAVPVAAGRVRGFQAQMGRRKV